MNPAAAKAAFGNSYRLPAMPEEEWKRREGKADQKIDGNRGQIGRAHV